MITEPTLLRIGQAVQLGHQGDRAAAHREFAQIWDEIGGERADPLVRCTLAHAMADVQDDVRRELIWDQRALAAADLITDERAAEAGVSLPVAGLCPLVAPEPERVLRKLGDLDLEHLRAAQATIGALGDDAYGQLIRKGAADQEGPGTGGCPTALTVPRRRHGRSRRVALRAPRP